MTAAVLALGLLACSGPDGADLSAPEGFEVSAETRGSQAEPLDAGGTSTAEEAPVAWRTVWELRWDAVEGADGYRARWSTSEGTPGGSTARDLDEPVLEIEVGAGTSAPERLQQDSDTAALMSATQLSVSVAATGADGEPGEWSAWFPVGDVPDDGRPVGGPGSPPG